MDARRLRFLILLLLLFKLGLVVRVWSAPAPGPGPVWGQAGVARVDVSPTEPIRLTGYASRQTHSTGVAQRLWAKALALGSDEEGPAVLITLDNCGLAERTYLEVVRRLAPRLRPGRLTIACSHTHAGPCTTDWAPNIFVRDLAAEEQAAIDRYTERLVGQLEQVAVAALADRQPATLAWSRGTASFARNRRTAGGPVDHSLPVLRVTAPGGALRAVVANYACHCTTLGGDFNQAHGDWAGCAQEAIERRHPGALALITIGCGADANPHPRGTTELVRQHGEEIGAAVDRLLGQTFRPLTSRLSARLERIELPFAPPFTRAQWEERAGKPGIVGYHARRNLARLDRGETLPAVLPYHVQTWNFGDELAMVFLNGEVVVDYALALQRMFDEKRLWVTAYANYVPCYIPSRRILTEGGYEAEDSLWYYDRPARLALETEELILATVRQLVPAGFQVDPQRTEFPDPVPADRALATFRTRAELELQLVAAEPLVQSPVAIDWGADGRLWVCEMFDYPTGVDGQGRPGGRIRVLTDRDGDGRMDAGVVFLDGLPFPTGVTPWGRGALVCAAPQVLYAEDTDGDGRADLVRTNLTGFATHNFQARVNGFVWGLDGWLHASSGLFGGKVTSTAGGREVAVDVGGRDFRYRPETGVMEPLAGISQMGRVRDEFDQWFGNDNGTLLWHYPLPDQYLRRNPHVAYPDPRLSVARGADPNRVHPLSRTLERFNDLHMANRVTSACGPEIYRDEWLGATFRGNAFVCEPVHNLVRRLQLVPDGATFVGRVPADENGVEFLASDDNWFRPVQVRTGPDGALWVVDMYRFLMEHPRWISAERLARIDVRAGAERGRIYRIVPRGQAPRPVTDLAVLSPLALAARLGSPNGPVRDHAHRELLRRPPEAPAERAAVGSTLTNLAASATAAGARAQALSVLAGLGLAEPVALVRGLRDPEPGVRRVAARLCEPVLAGGNGYGGFGVADDVGYALLELAGDPDAAVRCQLALTLGESKHQLATARLGFLLTAETGNPTMRAAILSSANGRAGDLLRSAFAAGGAVGGVVEPLVATAVAAGDFSVLDAIWEARGNPGLNLGTNHLVMLGDLRPFFQALDRTRLPFTALGAAAQDRLQAAMRLARVAAFDQTLAENDRVAAVSLFCREEPMMGADLRSLARLVQEGAGPRIEAAALETLRQQRRPEVAAILLAGWTAYPPGLRAAVLDLALSRPEWVGQVVEAAERGVILPAEIGLPARQRLMKGDDSILGKRARALFGASHTNGARAEVLRRYERVASLTGTPDAGGPLFDRHCAACHAYRGRGHAVGPNLVEFAGKTAADYVGAILDPNSAIPPAYVGYAVDTRDGRTLMGIVRGETAANLTLVQGGGQTETLLRSDIVSLRALGQSLMPEGLEQALSPQDLADLIAWLKRSAPAPFGTAAAQPEVAARAREEFRREGGSSVAEVSIAGDRLPYGSWLGRWPMPYCRLSAGVNRLAWRTVPVPLSLPARGVTRFRHPAAMGFASQPAGRFVLKLAGRAVLEFGVALGDEEWASADGKVRMRYTVMENNGEDSNGLLVLEVANDLLQPGRPAEFEITGQAVNSQRWVGIHLVGETP